MHGLLLEAGCTRGGRCHALEGAGALRIFEQSDEAALLASYQSVTGLIDREDAAGSRLLYYVLEGDPRNAHPTAPCWAVGECAYRKVLAWIEWEGAGQPRPQEIDCDVTEDPLPCR